ncbi:MAG: RNA polymerase sigma factor [Patescibacteria group bacterium]|nr:RNA polymerase sigma factor [Patescibacteria group bacterium]
MDDADFTAALTALLPQLRRFARRYGPDFEDIVQSAALNAWRGRRHFIGGDFRAWMFKVLRNTAAHAHARATCDKRDGVMVSLDDEMELSAPPTQDAWVDMLDAERAIMALTPTYRRAALSSIVGDSVEESAASMGCPAGTAKSRLNRARQQIASALSR